MSSTQCTGCGIEFGSRNAVFRHLKETNGACLDPKNYEDFVKYVVKTQKREKVVVLYGYIVDEKMIRNGQDAAQILMQVMEGDEKLDSTKVNRSYGNTSRGTDIVKQDDRTGATTELLATRLPPLTVSVGEWMKQINRALSVRLGSDASIRVLGRRKMPTSKFNAEMDVTHRRIEYLLPADFLYHESLGSRKDFFFNLPSFADGRSRRSDDTKERAPDEECLKYLISLKKTMQSLTTQIVKLDMNDQDAVMEKEFHKRKRQRSKSNQVLNSAKVSPEKQKATKSKQNDSSKKGQNVLRRKRFHNFTPTVMAHEFLAYRRLDRVYHRGTFRFAQDDRGTLKISEGDDTLRPFLLLSLTGDLFLTGQVQRVVGLFVALARGIIDEEIVECLFDEEYPNLVPTPPVPPNGMYAAEAFYIGMEGKAKAILTPRRCDRYADGWNDEATLLRVHEWQTTVRERVAATWLRVGADEDGRLIVEKQWTEEVLNPWAMGARQHLEEYRQWKSARMCGRGAASEDASAFDVSKTPDVSHLPPLESIDSSVPVLFEKVLYCLRQADASGLWPSTTPKRQLVMVSTLADGSSDDNESPLTSGFSSSPLTNGFSSSPLTSGFSSSLSAKHRIARTNKSDRSSAYAFAEGEGGASGSFSIGAMPGEQCIQPKANELFPELMKAAFELEIALCPDREPSSTIAVNRNAQFRPHTDSGAGAGQSTSLIVGLGTYVGGELVVEGEKKDIRYKAVVFNGWTERHWTMPFQGERYSLVWFTPKGCEGVRGIDLCK